VSRRTKGEISEYALDVIVRNLPFLRELLLEGRLVKEGIIDRTHPVFLFSKERARDPGMIAHIHDLIDIEAWLRSANGATYVSFLQHAAMQPAFHLPSCYYKGQQGYGRLQRTQGPRNRNTS
jgi:hypothetical protein